MTACDAVCTQLVFVYSRKWLECLSNYNEFKYCWNGCHAVSHMYM